VSIQFRHVAVADIAKRRPPSARIIVNGTKLALDGVDVATKGRGLVVVERQMPSRIRQKPQHV